MLRFPNSLVFLYEVKMYKNLIHYKTSVVFFLYMGYTKFTTVNTLTIPFTPLFSLLVQWQEFNLQSYDYEWHVLPLCYCPCPSKLLLIQTAV
jgi:hypothetical protein